MLLLLLLLLLLLFVRLFSWLSPPLLALLLPAPLLLLLLLVLLLKALSKRCTAAGSKQFVLKSQIVSEDAVVQAIIVEFVGHQEAHLIGSQLLRNSIIGSSISSIQMRIYLYEK